MLVVAWVGVPRLGSLWSSPTWNLSTVRVGRHTTRSWWWWWWRSPQQRLLPRASQATKPYLELERQGGPPHCRMEHLGGHRRLRQEQVRNLIINLGIGGCSHKCDTRAPMSLMYVRVNSVGEEARSCSPPVALVTDGTDISVWGGGGEGGRASGCRSPPTASPPAPTAGSPCRPSSPRGRAPPRPVGVQDTAGLETGHIGIQVLAATA